MRIKPIALLVAVALSSGCSQLNSFTQAKQTVDSTPQTELQPEPPQAISQQELLPTLKEPEVIEAPVEQIAELPAPETDLLARIRAGMTLVEKHQDARIEKQEKWYASHPSYFDRVLKRSERYLYHIVNEVEARDMPMELALLPAVGKRL